MSIERNYSIDLLRCIALLCTILAHVSPPSFIFQFRNFDVPLLVFISGTVFHYDHQYFQYIEHRIKRIVFPTWAFVTIYLFICLIGSSISKQTVIEYYTLQTRWYIWIMRVFLIVAIFAPFISTAGKLLYQKKLFWLCTIACTIVFETFCDNHNFSEEITIAYSFIEAVPYLFYFLVGSAISLMDKKSLIFASFAAAAIFLCLALYYKCQTGAFINTQHFKYPPRLYYNSYALFIILILWSIREQISTITKYLHINSIITFIGVNSIWIYFWHIIVLEFADFITMPWYTRFLLVLTIGGGLTYVQVKIFSKVCTHIHNKKLGQLLHCIFC